MVGWGLVPDRRLRLGFRVIGMGDGTASKGWRPLPYILVMIPGAWLAFLAGFSNGHNRTGDMERAGEAMGDVQERLHCERVVAAERAGSADVEAACSMAAGSTA